MVIPEHTFNRLLYLKTTIICIFITYKPQTNNLTALKLQQQNALLCSKTFRAICNILDSAVIS